MQSNSDSNPTFRLGLSLAGGISTGAYLAGAVDFIVEALDAFQAAKENGDPDAPPHDVVIETVCGASSGALTAAILASALRYEFEPANPGTDPKSAAGNPLFDCWVNMTGAAELLGSGDRNDESLKSVLDSTAIDRVTRKAIDFGVGLSHRNRTWVSDPLHICFTVTNLSGVPFSLANPAAAGHLVMTMHADVLRFGVSGIGGGRIPIQADERLLGFPGNPWESKWNSWGSGFANAAVASAAFPGLLAARIVQRPVTDYDSLPVLLPGEIGQFPQVIGVVPAWPQSIVTSGNNVKFVAADGGIMDNSPLDVARAVLNDRDISMNNPRDGLISDRAILMIDPMLEGDSGPARDPAKSSLLSNLLALFRALIDQARFRPGEIALAQREDVYSRFLIAPTRDGKSISGRNLAGSSLGGFGGYLAREFREHDYFVGRCNAQEYLSTKLVLPAGNPLFTRWQSDDRWPTWRDRHGVSDTGELPIIPLVGHLHPQFGLREPLPTWPKGKARVCELGPLIEQRLDLIYTKVVEQTKQKFPGARFVTPLLGLVWPCPRRWLRKAVIRQLRARLHDHDLE